MKTLFESFKNLYRNEECNWKKHLNYSLLLLLPALSASVLGYIDKTTPKTLMIALGGLFLVLFLLSIVPYFCQLGFYIAFCRDRLAGKLGIPQVNWGMIKDGIKMFPLCIVWTIYAIIFSLLFIAIPVGFGILFLIKHPILFSLIMIFSVLFLLVLFFIFIPFVSYVSIKYVKIGKYTPDMFNPFTIFKYMRKAFKKTLILALKVLGVSIIVGTAYSLVGLVVFLYLILLMGIIAFPSVTITMDNVANTPIYILLSLPAMTLAQLGQVYLSTTISFAAIENYIKIYNEEIED